MATVVPSQPRRMDALLRSQQPAAELVSLQSDPSAVHGGMIVAFEDWRLFLNLGFISVSIALVFSMYTVSLALQSGVRRACTVCEL